MWAGVVSDFVGCSASNPRRFEVTDTHLLTTGEMCNGEPIHDRRHQHDLFMELAASYDWPLRGAVRWQL